MKDKKTNAHSAMFDKWSRRDTLKLAAAAGLVSSWPLLPAYAEQKGDLRQRKIPGSDKHIPIVGLGSSGAFEGSSDEQRAAMRAVLRKYRELGGLLVDTSPTYGNAEENIGTMTQALGIRDQLFMATKVHERGRSAGIRQMEGSEAQLAKPLDLMQVHNLIDVNTQLKTLREWKEAGRIKYIGITHYQASAFDALEKLMKTEPLDFVQFNMSIITPHAEKRLLPLAADRGIAVIINRAFEDGRLFGITKDQQLPAWAADFDCESWAQFFLKYVISHPEVTCVIPATSDVGHLVDNMGAARGALPREKTRKRMRDYMAAMPGIK